MHDATLSRLLDAIGGHRTVVLATDPRSGAEELFFPDEEEARPAHAEGHALARAAARDERSGPVRLADGREMLLRVFAPPLELVLVGAVHIAKALAPMAVLAGYEVRIIDPRSAFASLERFPGTRIIPAWPDEALAEAPPLARTALVTLTHDPKLDDPALKAALASPAFYVGALGSRRTHAARLERLRRAGLAEPELERIRGPVGLAIGARSPEEIAIAILAEMTAVRRGAAGVPA